MRLWVGRCECERVFAIVKCRANIAAWHISWHFLTQTPTTLLTHTHTHTHVSHVRWVCGGGRVPHVAFGHVNVQLVLRCAHLQMFVWCVCVCVSVYAMSCATPDQIAETCRFFSPNSKVTRVHYLNISIRWMWKTGPQDFLFFISLGKCVYAIVQVQTKMSMTRCTCHETRWNTRWDGVRATPSRNY